MLNKKRDYMALALALSLVFAGNQAFASRNAMDPATRIKRQYLRIENGVKDGTLSQDVAAKLKQNVSQIESDFNAKRQADGGKLNPEDMKTIQSQLNENSDQIETAEGGGTKKVNSSNSLGPKWTPGPDGAQNTKSLKKQMKAEEKREVRQEKQALEQKLEGQQLDYEKQMVEKLGEQRPEIQKKKSDLQDIRKESGAD